MEQAGSSSQRRAANLDEQSRLRAGLQELPAGACHSGALTPNSIVPAACLAASCVLHDSILIEQTGRGLHRYSCVLLKSVAFAGGSSVCSSIMSICFAARSCARCVHGAVNATPPV